MNVRRNASVASLQNLSQESTIRLGSTTRRPKCILSRCSSFIVDRTVLKTEGISMEKRSNCPFSYVNSSCDDREAIRISREDGGVDITKEYRKLYLVPDRDGNRRRNFLAPSRFSMGNLQDVYSFS